MSGPHWLADTFAALLLGTAAYCVGRLVMARMRPRAVEHDVDMVHVVMGIAMAGMLVPAVDPVGNRSWEVVFVAAMAWFAWRAFREVLSAPSDPVGRRPSLGACGDVWRHGLHAGRPRCGVVALRRRQAGSWPVWAAQAHQGTPWVHRLWPRSWRCSSSGTPCGAPTA